MARRSILISHFKKNTKCPVESTDAHCHLHCRHIARITRDCRGCLLCNSRCLWRIFGILEESLGNVRNLFCYGKWQWVWTLCSYFPWEFYSLLLAMSVWKESCVDNFCLLSPPKNSINCFWQWASCVKLCKSCIDVASLLHLGTSTLDYNAKFKESFPVDFKVFLLEIVVRRSSPSGVKYVQQCPLLSNFNYRHTIENWKCNGLLPGKSIKLGLPWSNPL